jgi:hypothetical protein
MEPYRGQGGAEWVRYSVGSSLRVARRKRQVKVGHKVVLLPWASRYQLAQPPEAHTVSAIRR